MIDENRPLKPWYKKKRVWINVGAIVCAIATAFVPAVGPIASAAIMAGVGAINVALRVADKG